MKIRPLNPNNQSGMASFLVVTVIVTLLALVSLGFSTLANREGRQALDRQLSDEAYYAAESGVNDAINYINTGIAQGKSPDQLAWSSCQLPSANSFTQYGNLDAATTTKGAIRYSCVLINTKPAQLSFTVLAGQTKSFPIKLDPSNQVDNLYFSWQNATSTSSSSQPLGNFNNPPASPPDLPQDKSLGSDVTGLLRVGLYPVRNDAGTGNHNTNAILSAAARTYFFYPSAGSGAFDSNNTVDYGSNGTFKSGNCSNNIQPTLPGNISSKSFCNAKVTGLPNGNPDKYFVISLTARYQDLNVYVEATQQHGNNPEILQPIPDVQAVIDSTGAGNDVLRRIQAVAPLQRNINYGIQSMQAICKLFRAPVLPPANGQGQYGPAGLDTSTPSSDNSMCAVPPGSGAIN